MVSTATQPSALDFFVSYSPADERWAKWIAWVLQEAGYRIILQAWDFVAGSEFIEFMDRGVRESAAVIAVLSPNYLRSTYGRMEWQAALRSSPTDPGRRLIPIRIAECELEGLLATITYLDLLGVEDELAAREQLLARVREALVGRVAVENAPPFPTARVATAVPMTTGVAAASTDYGYFDVASRRRPMTKPLFPPTARTDAPKDSVCLLHLPGPRFGRGLVRPDEPSGPGQWEARVVTWLTRMIAAGSPEPDALLISGDLTETGSPRQADDALQFLSGLRAQLNLEPSCVALVPGPRDVNAAACRAYFDNCEADELTPRPPYWPKWRHFTKLFHAVYQGLDSPVFDPDQPWSLFEMPELRLVVAGFNSTVALSHRQDDQYGMIGEVQAAFFAKMLRSYERDGWLRVGLVAHAVPSAGRDTDGNPAIHAGSRTGAHRASPGLLRDADMFTHLLGSINLVVHGAEPSGNEIGWLPGTVPLVPPARSGTPQLLALTSSGLTRWTTDRSDQPGATGHETAWRAANATFRTPLPATGAQPEISSAQSPNQPSALSQSSSEAQESRTPVQELLDRITEVCEVRFDRARVRRIGGSAPHLRVAYAEEGYARTILVGAITGDAPETQLDQLVRLVHAAAPSERMELVHHLVENGALASLRAKAARAGLRLRSLSEFQGLLDLDEFLVGQADRLRRDPAYPAREYVPQRYSSLVGRGGPVQDDVVNELTRLVLEDDGRFVLLLGDFGRGKTFALRELTRRLTDLPGAPLPVLIDLRNLDRAHTVDGLVAAHLANHGNTVIDLRSFRYLLRHGRIALIFDGFDELVSRVSYDRAADHLETLVQAAQDDAKIIVASRSQHFRSREHVLTALGERVGLLPQRRVLQLEEFDPGQIHDYLTRVYGNPSAAEQRYRLFEQISDLKGLAKNPRMLAFLATFNEARLDTLARSPHILSPASLYEEIIEYWLNFESQRTSQNPGSPPGLSAEELQDAVTLLAVRLWERGEVYLQSTDLSEVAATLTKLATAMTAPEAEHALGSGSLLTRTDEGLFGFIHFSVCEWLVAKRIAQELAAGDDRLLGHRTLSGLALDFLCSLAPTETLDAWVRTTSEKSRTEPVAAESRARIQPAIENSLLIGSRLNVEITSDLRGADLAGQDLSHRSFQRVNLAGANLAGARLIGSNLAGADLTGANLTDTRLTETDLTGADLTGAKLDGARLLGTRLAGAKLTGSTWEMAALVGVDRADLTALPEFLGAAITPPLQVSLGFAPAEVGVPYGFEVGRIPDPVSYHPHGTTLVFGSADGSLLICDAATGRPVRAVTGHRARVYVVRHSPDGRFLLTGSADGSARIWDAVTFEELQVLRGHDQWVWPAKISASGRVVATGDATGAVRLWDTATGECTATLSMNVSRIWAVTFHPRGPGVATGEENGTVRIWDVSTGSIQSEYHCDSGSAYRVRFSPDGTHLASAHHDGTVYEHRIGDDTPAGTTRLEGTGRAVYCLRYHPSGRRLATGDTGGTVALWTLDRPFDAPRLGQEADSRFAADPAAAAIPAARSWAKQIWTRHSGAVYGLNFSRDGVHMASSDSDGLIRLGDPIAGTVEHELTGHRSSVWPMEFRPDGKMVATSSNDGTLRVWDANTGMNVNLLRGHGRRLARARYDATGTHIATSGSDGLIRVWDAATGRLVRRHDIPARRLESGFYSPDGSVVAGWDNSGVVHVWNAATGDYERQISTTSDHLWTAKFSPDGDVLATSEDDESVRLRYRKTGRVIAELSGHTGRIRSIAFSPDGKQLATAADDHDVRIWDLATGRCVMVLRGHKDRVYSVTFDPNSTLLASAGNDGVALIWDLAALSGSPGEVPGAPEPVHTGPRSVLERGAGRLWQVSINPSGTLAATASDDLSVRLWDVETGEHLYSLLGHTGRVWSAAFSPTEDALVSSGDDGTAVIWDLSPIAAGERPVMRMTLLGLADGWVAATPDGRYKMDGEIGSEVWHVVGNCRFPLDQLGKYVPHVRRVPPEDDLGRQ